MCVCAELYLKLIYSLKIRYILCTDVKDLLITKAIDNGLGF